MSEFGVVRAKFECSRRCMLHLQRIFQRSSELCSSHFVRSKSAPEMGRQITRKPSLTQSEIRFSPREYRLIFAPNEAATPCVRKTFTNPQIANRR